MYETKSDRRFSFPFWRLSFIFLFPFWLWVKADNSSTTRADFKIHSHHIYLTSDIFDAYNATSTILIEIIKPGEFMFLDSSGLEYYASSIDDHPLNVTQYSKDSIRLNNMEFQSMNLGNHSIKLAYGRKFEGSGFNMIPNAFGKSTIAFTNLEPFFAHTVFPCQDYPSFKTVYSSTVHLPTSYLVRFNTIVESSQTKNGWTTYNFKETIPLSSYLVAWYIFKASDFYIHTTNVQGIELNIISPFSNYSTVEWAMKIACRSLKYYSDVFDVSLPISKLDLVPVPNFSSEGMENFGLITIEATTLQVQMTSPLLFRQYSAFLIAHEIAHHWFGDVSTMKTFSNLFMNEGYSFLKNTYLKIL